MSGARLPGLGSHQSARSMSIEWLTPKGLLGALGPFDLDPCACLEHPDWVGATRSWTLVHDGLVQPWDGRVWLNAPYDELDRWMPRMAEHGQGIALVFARTETVLWQEWVWPHARAVLFLARRLTFLRPNPGGEPTASKAGHSSGGPSALVAYSDHDAEVLAGCGLRGALVGPARMT